MKKTNKKQYEAKYIPFNFNHCALYGSSGFGKSVLLNSILNSTFNSFELVDTLVFIDIKYEVEANPYRKMEERLKTGKIFTIGTDRRAILDFLEKVFIIIAARAEYLKEHGMEKIENKRIIIVIDEIAQLLTYTPQSKADKRMQERIIECIDNIFMVGRFADVAILYATQSPFGGESGLSSTMKQNSTIKLTMHLDRADEINSITPMFLEKGINPAKFKIGQFAMYNAANSTMATGVCLRVETKEQLAKGERYLDTLNIQKPTPQQIEEKQNFEKEMAIYYKQVVAKLKEDKRFLLEEEEEKEDYIRQVMFNYDSILEDLLANVLIKSSYKTPPQQPQTPQETKTPQTTQPQELNVSVTFSNIDLLDNVDITAIEQKVNERNKEIEALNSELFNETTNEEELEALENKLETQFENINELTMNIEKFCEEHKTINPNQKISKSDFDLLKPLNILDSL